MTFHYNKFITFGIFCFSIFFIRKYIYIYIYIYIYMCTNTYIYVHTYVYTRIYIYIYIYSHPQTSCFVVSQLLSMARHVGRLKLGSKPALLYIRLSIIPLTQQANHVQLGNYKAVSNSFRLLTFLCLTGYQSAQFFHRTFALCVWQP